MLPCSNTAGSRRTREGEAPAEPPAAPSTEDREGEAPAEPPGLAHRDHPPLRPKLAGVLRGSAGASPSQVRVRLALTNSCSAVRGKTPRLHSRPTPLIPLRVPSVLSVPVPGLRPACPDLFGEDPRGG